MLIRIDNNKSHINDNCVISCNDCNCARGKQNYNAFCKEKCLERFHRNVRPLVFNIDKDNKKIFYKLKHNVSGSSIVFLCIMKQIKHIQRFNYNIETNKFELLQKGKLVKKSYWI